jgi:tetratricopeptide (TPR) repeat protein
MAGEPLDAQPTYLDYLRAATADPLDPTPLAECSRWLVGYAELEGGLRDALARAIERLDEALERDPRNVSTHRYRRRLQQFLAETTGEPGDYQRAIASAVQVTRLYPESPNDWAALGECRLAAGETGDDAEVLAQAIEAFEEALRLDAARPDWEELRRFSEAKRSEIQERIRVAKRLLDGRPQNGQ